jgi:hypothetical protein
MRLHRAIFVGFHVLAVRTRAYGRRPLQSLMVSFRSGNELPYFSEVPRITHYVDLVHPFGHVHEVCTNKEENHKKLMIYIQNHGKERAMTMEESFHASIMNLHLKNTSLLSPP